jgi:putative intracellular protease/amidase
MDNHRTCKGKSTITTTDDGMPRRSFLKGGLGALVGASCVPALERHATAKIGQAATVASGTYVCPPCGLDCDKLTFDKPGNCPQCGMTLVPATGEGGPPKVAVLLFSGAQLIDFAGPWEVFGTAGFLVHTVAENLEPHTVVFGLKTVADYTFDNSPKSDILLVPGGGVPLRNRRVIEWIQAKSKEVSHVMSVCTGAHLLAEAGLLDGLSATITYGMEDALAKQGKDIKVVSPARFVDAGKIITTAGLTSGIDGALHLVSKILGTGAAESTALGMEYRWSPESNFARAALADRYLPDGLRFANARFKGAEAKLLSTAGDTDHWELRMLVSRPETPADVMAVISERIRSNTGHTRGPVVLAPAGAKGRAKQSGIEWKFTDDQGRGWRGTAVAEPSAEEKGSSLVTLRLVATAK